MKIKLKPDELVKIVETSEQVSLYNIRTLYEEKIKLLEKLNAEMLDRANSVSMLNDNQANNLCLYEKFIEQDEDIKNKWKDFRSQYIP